MNKHQWLLLFCINLLITIVILSPFLPGPGSLSTITNTIYTLLQFASLFLILIIPVGLVITINQIIKKEKMSLSFMLLWTLPATSFAVTLWGADAARNFSRKIAIQNASPIIQAIETYYQVHKKYPDRLSDLKPAFLNQMPSTGVMGISTYQYEKRDSSFAVIFTQNVLAGFNKEIVSYDPRHQYSADDSLNQVYPAGKDKWQYYILD
ncbi:MAG: hypothetical protein HYI21_06905 [Sediminibacterium sp. Gen4]|jgi:hypothetical protein|uniref:hypothetical protein n=1 Tax=unclassified Sediminibacterium TaxID=2635961 RepID=UPI0015BE0A99|nr:MULTISPECIES: hypothetical protein [unclassified Sediminibacterium]NWK65738.1 hypothetical protein [Sediminibacterium sp. Gen4]